MKQTLKRYGRQVKYILQDMALYVVVSLIVLCLIIIGGAGICLINVLSVSDLVKFVLGVVWGVLYTSLLLAIANNTL